MTSNLSTVPVYFGLKVVLLFNISHVNQGCQVAWAEKSQTHNKMQPNCAKRSQNRNLDWKIGMEIGNIPILVAVNLTY